MVNNTDGAINDRIHMPFSADLRLFLITANHFVESPETYRIIQNQRNAEFISCPFYYEKTCECKALLLPGKPTLSKMEMQQVANFLVHKDHKLALDDRKGGFVAF